MNEFEIEEKIIKLINDYELNEAFDLFISSNVIEADDFIHEIIKAKLLDSDYEIEDEEKEIIKKLIQNSNVEKNKFTDYFINKAEQAHYEHLEALHNDGFTSDYDGPPKEHLDDGKKLISDFIEEINSAINEKNNSLTQCIKNIRDKALTEDLGNEIKTPKISV